MDIYVILSVGDFEELEHFTQEKWEITKTRINPDRVLYVTPDINDERLNVFDSIVWERVFNQITKQYQKSTVPFTKDVNQMAEESNKNVMEILKKIEEKTVEMAEARARRIERKKEKNLLNGNYDNLNNAKAEMDELIPLSMNEFDALATWRKLDCRQPAGRRIEQIKLSYNMSWNAFAAFVRNNFN